MTFFTTTDIAVLTALQHHGPTTVQRLAKRTGLTVPAIYKAVNKLVNLDIIVKTNSTVSLHANIVPEAIYTNLGNTILDLLMSLPETTDHRSAIPPLNQVLAVIAIVQKHVEKIAASRESKRASGGR